MKLFKDLGFIIIGSLLYALALTMLAMPNKLAEGGVPGASIILHYAFDWSAGITNFILTAAVIGDRLSLFTQTNNGIDVTYCAAHILVHLSYGK